MKRISALTLVLIFLFSGTAIATPAQERKIAQLQQQIKRQQKAITARNATIKVLQKRLIPVTVQSVNDFAVLNAEAQFAFIEAIHPFFKTATIGGWNYRPKTNIFTGTVLFSWEYGFEKSSF